MRIAAVIMECNPFHEGHRYILEQARKMTQADYVIVIMSGDFVQRGEPAVFSKEERTEAVLRNGADLVLELPVPYATGAADYFARGAVACLSELQVVTDLVFGSGCGDLDKLQRIAAVLDQKPPALEEAIRRRLAEGYSYPAAQAQALQQTYSLIMPDDANDLLAIEYLKAISWYQRRHPEHGTIHNLTAPDRQEMVPHAVRRVTSDNASQIRQELRRKDPSLLSPDTFSAALLYQLAAETALGEKSDIHLRSNHEDEVVGLSRYADVSPDLARRIERMLPEFRNYSSFAAQLKTKNYTSTRIMRALLHVLLRITKEDMALYEAHGLAGYVRLLGFRREAASLLSLISASSTIPVITRPARALHNSASTKEGIDTSAKATKAVSRVSDDFYASPTHQLPQLQPPFDHMFQKDIAASELYDLFSDYCHAAAGETECAVMAKAHPEGKETCVMSDDPGSSPVPMDGLVEGKETAVEAAGASGTKKLRRKELSKALIIV